jgi:hypothetical protein
MPHNVEQQHQTTGKMKQLIYKISKGFLDVIEEEEEAINADDEDDGDDEDDVIALYQPVSTIRLRSRVKMLWTF